jgi:hypothetical protein
MIKESVAWANPRTPAKASESMRDLNKYPDRNQNVVIQDEVGATIYGFKLLRQIVDSGQGQQVALVKGISLECFIAYLQMHFPNYGSVRELADEAPVSPEVLERISDSVTLEVGDAAYMLDIERSSKLAQLTAGQDKPERSKATIDEEVMHDFERHCPATYQAICSKRYLLPNKRQSDYANQDRLNEHLKLVLLRYALGREGKTQNQSSQIELINLIQAINYERPTLYLERELGQALLRTDLPEDLSTDDLHWPWPGFRLMLPGGLCAAAHDGRRVSLQYLDLSLGEAGQPIRWSDALLFDLFKGLKGCGYQIDIELLSRGFVHPSGTFYGCGLTDFQLAGYQPDTVTWVGGWDDRKLRELVKSSGNLLTDLSEPEQMTMALLLEGARCLALNVLIFLSQEPIDYQPEPFLRLPRMEGRHFKPGLAKARFVGDFQPRSRSTPGPKSDEHNCPAEPSDITRAPHWVRGHWARIAHGKGRSLRRLTWIRPYRTGQPDDEAVW